MEILKHNHPFQLENGETLPGIDIAYTTYGTLNDDKDNVIWICHALTANSEAHDWWNGLVGSGKIFDPDKYFIVCANILGSCYSSTGPTTVNPTTGKKYGKGFPLVTIIDMVKAHQILLEHLDIQQIYLSIGGSMGGQQVLEWAIMDPELFQNICVLASNAVHSPWGIAFNEAQRMAIEADPTLYEDHEEAGKKGLEAARAVAMLSYRHYQTYQETQQEKNDEKIDDFLASSYQRYQGLKLFNRFEVLSYLTLSKAMDSHNVGRGRGSVAKALQQIKAKALIIGIHSDILFPVDEQMLIAQEIPGAELSLINSLYGHDGFLIESDQITALLNSFLLGDAFYKARAGKRIRRGRNGKITGQNIALPGTEKF